MDPKVSKVMAAMSAAGLARTSPENVADVLEALAKVQDARAADLERQLDDCVRQSGQWASLAGMCKGRMARMVAWLRTQATAADRTGDRAHSSAFIEAHNVALAIHEDRVDDHKFQLQARDLDKPAEAQGLFHKFLVYRVDGSDLPGGRHEGCFNFVLDVTHDPYAVPALQAYATACAITHPDLARDLFAHVGVPPELTDTGVERRRELQTAPLPRDAECALEHAAVALDKAGEAEAHAHVTAVIAQHLPDDQAFDRNAERITREAGLGDGVINPDATDITDLFIDPPEEPRQ